VCYPVKAWFEEADHVKNPKRLKAVGTGIEDAPGLLLKVVDEVNNVAANVVKYVWL
jgi:hypothetical protein